MYVAYVYMFGLSISIFIKSEHAQRPQRMAGLYARGPGIALCDMQCLLQRRLGRWKIARSYGGAPKLQQRVDARTVLRLSLELQRFIQQRRSVLILPEAVIDRFDP